MNKKTKPSYPDMSLAELRAATRQYDDPDFQPKRLPVTAEERARLDRTIRNLRRGYTPGVRGRAKVGQGVKRVLITVEAGLLQRADDLARRRKMNRSQLIAASLAETLARPRAA